MEQAEKTAVLVVESNLKASKEALEKRIADNKTLRIHLNKSGESGSGFNSGGIAVLDTIDVGLSEQINHLDKKLKELHILISQDKIAKIFE